MENPATWDELDRAVAALITQYHLDQDAGVIGLSLTRTIADFIRDRDVHLQALYQQHVP